MEAELKEAIDAIHPADGWVHLATIGHDGSPHVAPMMLAVGDDVLLFSLTGMQKKLNLKRDPRATVSIGQSGTLSHVIAWGTIEMRHDDEAQRCWEKMMVDAFGEAGLEKRSRALSPDGTSLGVMTVSRHRIFNIQ
tara:strand:+ start:531 stop:938 length:408 start_codon:yes stop_codon:yes gene_type:complete